MLFIFSVTLNITRREKCYKLPLQCGFFHFSLQFYQLWVLHISNSVNLINTHLGYLIFLMNRYLHQHEMSHVFLIKFSDQSLLHLLLTQRFQLVVIITVCIFKFFKLLHFTFKVVFLYISYGWISFLYSV